MPRKRGGNVFRLRVLIRMRSCRNNTRMTIQAILLDLDDTLVVEYPGGIDCFLAVGEATRARHGLDPRRLHEAVLCHARDLWHNAPTGAYVRRIGLSSWEGLSASFEGEGPELAALRAWAPVYRHESWTRGLADCGISDPVLADELAEAFCRHHAGHAELFPKTLDTLDSLRGRYRLAVVSNGVADVQYAKLDITGLRSYFDVVAVSADVGIGKPDPLIFGYALDRLEVVAGEAIMVGNSLARDIVGARNAGIRAVWVDRERKPPELDVIPDARITCLSELLSLPWLQ